MQWFSFENYTLIAKWLSYLVRFLVKLHSKITFWWGNYVYCSTYRMLLKYQKVISNNKYGFQCEEMCAITLLSIPKPNLIMLIAMPAAQCPMNLQLKKVIVHNRVSKQCLFVSTIQIGNVLLCPASTFFHCNPARWKEWLCYSNFRAHKWLELLLVMNMWAQRQQHCYC